MNRPALRPLPDVSLRRARHAVRAFHAAMGLLAGASAQAGDARLREVRYDPRQVITAPVRVGVVTDVVLDADESISDVAAGQSADCARAQARWCVSVQPGGHHLFIEPRAGATGSNNLAVVTDKRVHSFRFVVQSAHDSSAPCYRLTVRAALVAPLGLDHGPDRGPPRGPVRGSARTGAGDLGKLGDRDDPRNAPQATLWRRLHAAPRVVNADYSMVGAEDAEDIAPALVFDDGRFTYFRFAPNHELPAVFEVRAEGAPTLVNLRMEDELLVADRVSRRFLLRAGLAQVGVWNEAYDADGIATEGATTAPGVVRVLRSESAADAASRGAP